MPRAKRTGRRLIATKSKRKKEKERKGLLKGLRIKLEIKRLKRRIRDLQKELKSGDELWKI